MGWQTWLNSNAMAALATPNLFGLMGIPQLMDLEYSNVLNVVLLEQKT